MTGWESGRLGQRATSRTRTLNHCSEGRVFVHVMCTLPAELPGRPDPILSVTSTPCRRIKKLLHQWDENKRRFQNTVMTSLGQIQPARIERAVASSWAGSWLTSGHVTDCLRLSAGLVWAGSAPQHFYYMWVASCVATGNYRGLYQVWCQSKCWCSEWNHVRPFKQKLWFDIFA